jgi:hypothetical protein
MKKACSIDRETGENKSRKGLTGFLENKFIWMREKDFTCPVCREVLHGISSFAGHIRDHCT